MKLLKSLSFLGVILAAAMLYGCGADTAVTGENIGEKLPDLLEQEVFLENVYRGAGLPTTPNAPYEPDENYQCFVVVTDEAYPTIEALKEATEKIFTKEYAEKTFYADAFDSDYARYREVDGQLCMDIGVGGALDRQWDLTSYEVLEEDDETIQVAVDYLNYGSVYTAEITFVKTDDGVRIDALKD